MTSCMMDAENNMDDLNTNPHQKSNQQQNFGDNPPPVVYSKIVYSQIKEPAGSQMQSREAIQTAASSGQSESFQVESTEMSRRLWIAPSRNLSSTSSVKKRLRQAVEYLKESARDRDALIQIWVPTIRGGRRVLSTYNQPFSLNPNCKNLADYREVSTSYSFAAEENSEELVGLPGRVFLKKLPEWTPDVRFFKREEYPRVNYARQYNVRGSLALPVFERGSGTCLGVVEIVTTTQKANYHPELENICKALEAVDLRSSETCCAPKIKAWNDSYQNVLTEIQMVLKSVCDMHGLPLAQTWAPCIQHGKGRCRHSDENYAACVSTIDSACYVPNPQVLGFHEACSEHHLLRGEGVAGRAFMTNQPCFAADVTVFSKAEYPLSHYARMFGLHGTVAIRLRSIYTESADFVLEFFLPLNCQDSDEQKGMLNSLSSVLQHVCQSLRVVTGQELEEETILPVSEMVAPSSGILNKELSPKHASSSSNALSQEKSSWIAHMMEGQQNGSGVAVSLGYQNEEPKDEFKVTTHWDNNEVDLHHASIPSPKKLQQDSELKGIEGTGDLSSFGRYCPAGARKAGEKRRAKTEKTISLQVLRQYFAGSLKDAAKSIGVCPTTLKRICRQHGITRWPSRKLKKVSHSLKKLQLVIESVEGSEGAIQLASFYNNFPELRSPTVTGTTSFSTSKINDDLKELKTEPEGSLLNPDSTSSKSPSSSCNHSSSSSLCFSTGAKQPLVTASAFGSGDALFAEEPTGLLKRTCSEAYLHDSCQEEMKVLARSQSHKLFGEHPSLEALLPSLKTSSQVVRDAGILRIKATFGEEKIRFSMPQNWGFGDLQQEIARRFSIEDVSRIDLKYLDDDSEWVLLTCDADLEECIDIYRSSNIRTIKLSLHLASHPNYGSSFGSNDPS
ncbi:protein NLP2-like isoform X2 [Cornus florida]|uniref:protein NLP2-like isoform X2 n=1 Tax=Cornus florida TaxID=4283 RepID=UPI00289E1396|nr:protein NLP2-like isoform X2 [Cornus florida]